MEFLGVIFIVIVLWVAYAAVVMHVTVMEYECVLLYHYGSCVRVLGPGRYTLRRAGKSIERVSLRRHTEALSGQELICADGLSAKLSLVATYRVAEPQLAINEVEKYRVELHLALQNALREVVAGFGLEDLLARRNELGAQVLALAAESVGQIGLELKHVVVRDIMLPGALKAAFQAEITARQEARAELERARGEAAVLRSMANTAQLLEKSPQLIQLKLLQTLAASSGNTIVVDAAGQFGAVSERTGS